MTLVIKDAQPLDGRYGMGRGVPIARHYINRYFERLRDTIRGVVLEFGAPTYAAAMDCTVETITVDEADDATFHMDICDPAVLSLRNRYYDYVICTSVLHLVANPRQAVVHMHELLKPGGCLLVAEKCVSRIDPWLGPLDKWRFTPSGLQELLTPFHTVEMQAFGNLYTMCAYVSGMAAEEIEPDKLEYHDPNFPILAIARAVRASTP